MIIPVKTKEGSYEVIVERGALSRVGDLFKLDRRVLIVTDTGVPEEYAKKVASFCENPVIFTFPEGERSKNIDTYQKLLASLIENGFTRSDAVVAVGGGVVGDLAGFVASTFMRGIDFYNIPTTVLSCVDSSIGGKTAIDFMGIKNIVGAFYPPKKVLIDPDTLKTLPTRQISNGIAEAVKMAATSDEELFEYLETCDTSDMCFLDFAITRSLLIKKRVVEEDERETGLRRVLNFGHTLAHAIESATDFDFYHGECVALGMIPMTDECERERLVKVLEKFSLPSSFSASCDELLALARHDKKTSGEDISLVFVHTIGSFEIKKVPFSEFEKIIKEVK